MSQRICLHFRIDLESDVIFTADTATTGMHRNLNHIPGSVFLGVVAAAHYATMSDDLTWQMFHAGAVRFGNGLPLSKGEVHLPLPRSWHAQKARSASEAKWHKDGLIQREKIADLSCPDIKDPPPLEPLDGGYVSATGGFCTPDRRFRRRTAIDRNTGRVDEGALFGYTALRAGQSFVSTITVDLEDADAARRAREAIVAALTAGPVRLGRSRQAEYGRSRISQLDSRPHQPDHGSLDRDRVILLAQSDCALPQPAKLKAEDFGLPSNWRPETKRSFLNWRRLSLFNVYRRAFDPDMVLLTAGSVLSFTGPPLTPAQQKTHLTVLDQGVGLQTALGFGVFLANPNLVGHKKPHFDLRDPAFERHVKQAAVPADALGVWLMRRHSERQFGDRVRALSRTYVDRFQRLYQELWQEGRLAGRTPSDMAPSRAQWGSVRDQAQLATDYDNLLHRLFNDADGLCTAGAGGAPWQTEAPGLRLRGCAASAGALLRQIVGKQEIETAFSGQELRDDQVTTFAVLLLTDLAVHVPRMIGELERKAA